MGLLDFKFDETNMSIEEIEAMLDAYHNKLRYVKLKNDVILEVKETDAKELNNFLEDFNLTEKAFPHDIKAIKLYFKAC